MGERGLRQRGAGEDHADFIVAPLLYAAWPIWCNAGSLRLAWLMSHMLLTSIYA